MTDTAGSYATPSSFLGAIFLQSVPVNRSLHDDAPSISEGWGGKVSDYRIMVSIQHVSSPLSLAPDNKPTLIAQTPSGDISQFS